MRLLFSNHRKLPASGRFASFVTASIMSARVRSANGFWNLGLAFIPSRRVFHGCALCVSCSGLGRIHRALRHRSADNNCHGDLSRRGGGEEKASAQRSYHRGPARSGHGGITVAATSQADDCLHHRGRFAANFREHARRFRGDTPLATPVLGGMVSSLAHVLIVTPIIFLWLRERELRRGLSQPVEAHLAKPSQTYPTPSKENL